MSKPIKIDGLVSQSKEGVWLITYFEGSKEKIEKQCKKNKVQLLDIFHIATFSTKKRAKK